MSDDRLNRVIGSGARWAALVLLDGVFRRGVALSDAPVRGLGAPDAALARAIAGEVLRWTPDLDALIDSATARALPDDAKARMVLRIALAQAVVLGTPPHAAISTTLPLVAAGPRRLVHGVFGTLMRAEARLPEVPTLPAPIDARWRAAWGGAMIDDARAALAHAPPLDVTLRDPDDDGGLGGDSLMPGHRRLPRGTSVVELPGYAEGKFWVQNISASIPARLLGSGHGRTVLDLCAAPGGKTMQLAAQGWRVIAVEGDARRATRLRENLARSRLDAQVVIADVMQWEPAAPVNAILLDAPCTSTGIFARHPDVLWRIGPRDIAAMAQVQAAMLARAARWLAPGGRLVYAVCSLEREEGEDVVAASGLRLGHVAASDLPPGVEPMPDGSVRILPKPGRDGFFIAPLLCGASG